MAHRLRHRGRHPSRPGSRAVLGAAKPALTIASAKLSPIVLRLEYRYTNCGEVEVFGIDTGIDATVIRLFWAHSLRSDFDAASAALPIVNGRPPSGGRPFSRFPEAISRFGCVNHLGKSTVVGIPQFRTWFRRKQSDTWLLWHLLLPRCIQLTRPIGTADLRKCPHLLAGSRAGPPFFDRLSCAAISIHPFISNNPACTAAADARGTCAMGWRIAGAG